MGNSTSKSTASASKNAAVASASASKRRSSSSGRGKSSGAAHGAATSTATASSAADFPTRAQQLVGESYRDLQQNIQSGIKRLEEQDHPAAQLLDSICSPYLETKGSFYSSDNDDSHTVSEDETTATDPYHVARRKSSSRSSKKDPKLDDRSTGGSESYMSTSDYESVEVVDPKSRRKGSAGGAAATATAASSAPTKESTDDESNSEANLPAAIHHNSKKQPLASSFAKRCFFTKAGIGGQTQHYEGLTLTGNVVLMLASAMKLKGCPTICDEDLRRVEQTYPNQFSRLPDELLLSSGWRRISKYCHFSNKPIPDGVPFFRTFVCLLLRAKKSRNDSRNTFSSPFVVCCFRFVNSSCFNLVSSRFQAKVAPFGRLLLPAGGGGGDGPPDRCRAPDEGHAGAAGDGLPHGVRLGPAGPHPGPEPVDARGQVLLLFWRSHQPGGGRVLPGRL